MAASPRASERCFAGAARNHEEPAADFLSAAAITRLPMPMKSRRVRIDGAARSASRRRAEAMPDNGDQRAFTPAQQRLRL